MKVAVLGSSGTVGAKLVRRLKAQGTPVVEVSRSHGVDLATGAGLHAALHGVTLAIDVSSPLPTDYSRLVESFTSTARGIVDACLAQGVQHLVYLSIIGIEAPVFNGAPYYEAKRAQEAVVKGAAAPLRTTVVQATQFHEFALHPTGAEVRADRIVVEDWLVQPIAADAVAADLIEVGMGDKQVVGTRKIAGPQRIKLPELTRRLMARLGDARPVEVKAVAEAERPIEQGVLTAPEGATILGPDVDAWLDEFDEVAMRKMATPKA